MRVSHSLTSENATATGAALFNGLVSLALSGDLEEQSLQQSSSSSFSSSSSSSSFFEFLFIYLFIFCAGLSYAYFVVVVVVVVVVIDLVMPAKHHV